VDDATGSGMPGRESQSWLRCNADCYGSSDGRLGPVTRTLASVAEKCRESIVADHPRLVAKDLPIAGDNEEHCI
jgi:hypothetical protein